MNVHVRNMCLSLEGPKLPIWKGNWKHFVFYGNVDVFRSATVSGTQDDGILEPDGKEWKRETSGTELGNFSVSWEAGKHG